MVKYSTKRYISVNFFLFFNILWAAVYTDSVPAAILRDFHGILFAVQSAPHPSYVKLMSQTFLIQNPGNPHNFFGVMVS